MKDEKYNYTRYSPTGLIVDSQIPLSTRLILQAAEECGVQWTTLPGTRIIELEYNGVKKQFRYQISTETTDIGFYSCLDKSVTNQLLGSAGVSVPKGFNLTRDDSKMYWMEVFNALQKPLVVKPTHGNQGNCITMNIHTEEEYILAVEQAFDFLNDPEAGVIVEQTCKGNEYRILATREKVLGILYRMPANVAGDGVSTIEQLIAKKNEDPRRGREKTFALFIIDTDRDVRRTLEAQGLTLESVPQKDERIFVRQVSNIAKGGDSIDVTDEAHPSVSEIALKAINAIPGMHFAGIDFMTEDITAPQTADTHTVIEVNSSPGFCIQVYPYSGKSRRAQYEFLKLAFPDLQTPPLVE